MFVDTGEIRIVSSALDLVDTDTFSIHKTVNNEDITSSRIYVAFVAGINVYLNSHKDNDFTYCVTSVHMKREYKVDDKIVLHFAFPKLNVATPSGLEIYYSSIHWKNTVYHLVPRIVTMCMSCPCI